MLKLYGFLSSGNVRRVRWALEELDASYEIVSIDPSKGEQKKPEFLALNPNGKLPVIDDEGFVLWESDAILWYLGEARGRGTILPEALRDRALVQQWMFWNVHHLAQVTYQARVIRMTALRMGKPHDEKRHAEIVSSAGPTLAILDKHLGGRDFVVGAGPKPSIADISLAMNTSFGVEEGVSLDGFANVRRWLDALVARPAWRTVNG